MREVTLKESQELELGLLKYLKKICEENDLKYFLAYGTLIGAVRHNGFIPWDDDIDVVMPREDYLKLVDIMKKEPHEYYELISIETHPEFTAPMPKMIDKRTKLVQHYDFIERTELGIYIDIFVMDGLGNTKSDAEQRWKKTCTIYKCWNYADMRLFRPDKSKLHCILRWLRNVPFKLYGITNWIKTKNKFDSQIPYHSSEYVACTSSGWLDPNQNIWKRSDLGEGIQMKFEDTEFTVPVEYDKILRSGYGDYMQLPPEEKRITHHLYEAWWKEGTK